MEKISLTDRVKNEVLRRVKDGRNILRTVHRRKVNWILCSWYRASLKYRVSNLMFL